MRLREKILSIILIAIIFTQAIGFLGSLIFSENDSIDVYKLSYILDIWLPRIIYPLIAIAIIFRSGLSRILVVNFFNWPIVGVLIIVALQVNIGAVTAAVFAAAFFVIWINQWNPTLKSMISESSDSSGSYFLDVLIIYLILPIILLCIIYVVKIIFDFSEIPAIIDKTKNNGLFRGESFRGFARDRIMYSYLCGLAVLYIFSTRHLCLKNLMYLGLLISGLMLAGSRAVLVALFFCWMFFHYSETLAFIFFGQ